MIAKTDPTDQTNPATAKRAEAIARPEVSADVVAQILSDFLRQLSTLSLAAAGGTVTLMQTAFEDTKYRVYLIVAVGILFCAAVLALQTQQVLVERLAEKTQTLKPAETPMDRFKMKRTAKTERKMMLLSFVLFGAGVGMVIMTAVMEFMGS